MWDAWDFPRALEWTQGLGRAGERAVGKRGGSGLSEDPRISP